MSNQQDQLDELEAIGAIFVDEHSEILEEEKAKIIESNGWGEESVSHLVRLRLEPQPDDSGKIHIAVFLVCAMTEDYPSNRPLLTACHVEKGLGETHLAELIEICRNAAESNVGMPSIYLVVEAAKEWLQINNLPGLDGSMYSEMVRRMQYEEVERKLEVEKAAIKHAADSERRVGDDEMDEAELERIRKRQAGTMVTVETFMAWKKSFDEEMALKNSALAEIAAATELRLSGKQWFLQQKNGGAESEDVDEDAFIAQLEKEAEEEEAELEEDDEDYEPGESEEEEGGGGGEEEDS
eukprot:gene2422-2655_t